ncbi:MAG: hypothetical protein ACC657_14715 [Thiohalomonadales bacterium]
MLKPISFLILSSLLFSIFYSNTLLANDKQVDNKALIQVGKQIYQQGILRYGKPLTGIGAGEIELSGSQASCIRCHRRSGFGSTEGDLRISPIIGEILYDERNKSYQQWNKHRTKGQGARPAYTDKTLINAMTQGTGADNRILNVLMPRYKLSSYEAKAVIAYLKSLSIKTEHGITKTDIHIATLFTSDVPDSARKTMVNLLTVFIKDVNAKTRKEQRRASNSPWHKKWEYESYRTIKLHIWELTGPESSWKQQLQNHYKKQAVFAVVNGISNQPWNVIHQFCNQTELPCLFPTTEIPMLSNDNVYNFYYSGGISYDAKSIASHIKKIPNKQSKNILQIYRNSAKNNSAVKSLQTDLQLDNIKIRQHIISNKQSLSAAQWSKIINQYKPDIIVSWLNENDIKALNSNAVNLQQIERFYFSYSHLGENYSKAITSPLEKSYLVYRYMLPKLREQSIKRATVWAKRKKIDISQEKIIGNSFFAVTLLNRSIKKMRAYLKRDYLVEIIESALENNVFNSVYPDLSLGPDQRIASKGAYIIGPLNNKDINKKQNHVWIRH